MLRTRFVQARRVLAAQLVGQYKAPEPDIVTVVLNSDGFAQLVERVDQLKRIARQNLVTTVNVRAARDSVDRQASRLAGLEANQQRVTTAVLVQRDQVGQLRLAMVARQLVDVRARAHQASELAVLREHRQTLERRLSAIQAKEAAAQARSVLGAVPGIGGGGFSGGDGGSYGFFPAPGTNYSVGSEPEIAARLDRLGKALHLHLIGISGYRTPQHSVEVGGFANDPHTRGEASDTPGSRASPRRCCGASASPGRSRRRRGRPHPARLASLPPGPPPPPVDADKARPLGHGEIRGYAARRIRADDARAGLA